MYLSSRSKWCIVGIYYYLCCDFGWNESESVGCVYDVKYEGVCDIFPCSLVVATRKNLVVREPCGGGPAKSGEFISGHRVTGAIKFGSPSSFGQTTYDHR